jgi:DNA-binding NarL/FixJ family response regulator
MDYFGWFLIYFLLINVVTTEKRFFIILIIFCLASFKLSFFGARSWTMRGFSFTSWGIQGPPGYFMNSGELSIQMLMFAPVAYEAAIFLRPYLSRIKFGILMLMPVTAAMTVIGASSRGSQVALVYQFYRSLLKGKLTFKKLAIVGVLGVIAFSLLPEQQKARFQSLGSDGTSTQRLLYWKHGAEMVREHPVLGVGYFNFGKYYADHWPEDMHFRVAQLPHNIFVQVGTDTGITGLIVFGMILIRNFRCAREIRAHCPDTSVLLLSMYDDERYVHDALRAGASGYVLKRQADAELIEAVRAVASGGRFVSDLPGVTLDGDLQDPLTPRELDVVKLIAEAYTNRQIAEILSVSEKTVESHRANVLSKLGMRDRVELVRYAIKRGLVEP